MKRVIVTAALFAAMLPAKAQVYKCLEGGKTVYSEIPCAKEGQQIDLHVHQPSRADQLRAQAQSRREKAFNSRVDAENDAARLRSRAISDEVQAQKDAKAAKCSGYESEIKRREATQDKWISPALRQQDRDRVRELKDKHFSECFAR